MGRKPVLLIGAGSLFITVVYAYHILALQTFAALISALFLLGFLASIIMVYPSILVELFPTAVRYTGVAISYNLAFAFFGGLTPLIATYLIETTGNVLAPSYYLMTSALLCIVAILTVSKTYT